MQSYMVLPLVVRGQVVGLLILMSREARDFDDQDAEFTARLASAISLALGNAELYQGERRSVRLAEALNAVNELLLSTLSMDEILERIVQEASIAAGADAALIAEPDGDDWIIGPAHGFDPSPRGQHMSARQALALNWAKRSMEPVLIEDTSSDRRVNRRLAKSFGMGAYVLFPLTIQGELQAVLQFGYHKPVKFDQRDVQFAQRLSTAMSLALENARLYQTERGISETLQETLLVVPHRIKGVNFSRLYRAATTSARVGGDFIDVFQLSGRRVAFALGDVSGKGLQAATLTATARNTLRAHAVDNLPPSVVAAKTNELLRLFTSTETFVTALFGVLDTRTGKLTYVNAGHPPGFIVSPNGRIHHLKGVDPVLGAFSDVEFHDHVCVLERHDSLVAYSDGITEARRGGELYGEERLEELVSRPGRQAARGAGARDLRGGQRVQQREPEGRRRPVGAHAVGLGARRARRVSEPLRTLAVTSPRSASGSLNPTVVPSRPRSRRISRRRGLGRSACLSPSRDQPRRCRWRGRNPRDRSARRRA